MAKKEEDKPKPRGGYRENAGRKPKDKCSTITFTVRIRKDFMEIIEDYYESRSDFIQRAIKEKLRRDGYIQQ